MPELFDAGRERLSCFCCNAVCPYRHHRAERGWIVRAFGKKLNEAYCPTCFAAWGLPTLPFALALLSPDGRRTNPIPDSPSEARVYSCAAAIPEDQP